MNVYFSLNTRKPETLPVAKAAAALLAGEGVSLLADPDVAVLLSSAAPVQPMAAAGALAACDVVLTVGGDGTMLHTARDTLGPQKPLLGINTGRLGFLTLLEPDELQELKRLPRGAYTVEQRSLLCASVQPGEESGYLALNDVVLFKESAERTITLDIACDGIPVSHFRGDGVVFATPTGSTAYSMSAGGPILDTRLGGIVVTSICAHIVNTPPMVFAANRCLRVTVPADEAERVFISCDGVPAVPLPSGAQIAIRQSDSTVPFVQFSDTDQLKSIDKKLKGR